MNHSIFTQKDIERLVSFQQEVLAKHGVTLEHLLWIINLSKEERDAYVVKRENVLETALMLKTDIPHMQSEKFVMLADLGIITVPTEYVHKVEFVMGHVNGSVRYHSNDTVAITGAFLNPERILKAGDKLHARVFKRINEAVPISVDDLFAFFTKEKAVYTGLQGASLVLELKRKQLPIGYSCVSFEKSMNLCFLGSTLPTLQVPCVEAVSAEKFLTNKLDIYFICQRRYVAFLVFTDVPVTD